MVVGVFLVNFLKEDLKIEIVWLQYKFNCAVISQCIAHTHTHTHTLSATVFDQPSKTQY